MELPTNQEIEHNFYLVQLYAPKFKIINMKFIINTTLFLFSISCNGQINSEATFSFLDSTENAQINQRLIGQLNEFSPRDSLLKTVFAPIKGKNKVFRFIADDMGEDTEESGIELMTWVIIIEVNDKYKVIQAYYYRINNPFMPHDAFLFRMIKDNLYLKKGMTLNEFNFHCKAETMQLSNFTGLKDNVRNMLLSW